MLKTYMHGIKVTFENWKGNILKTIKVRETETFLKETSCPKRFDAS